MDFTEIESFNISKNTIREPAVSVMALSLDSHVVDRGSHPGPSGLKLTPGTCACVPKTERRMEEKGLGHDHPPLGADFSLSVSLFLSVCLMSTRALLQKPLQKKRNFLNIKINIELGTSS